jgi:hypothetical protein
MQVARDPPTDCHSKYGSDHGTKEPHDPQTQPPTPGGRERTQGARVTVGVSVCHGARTVPGDPTAV